MWRGGSVERLSPDEPGRANDIFRAMVLELAAASLSRPEGVPSNVVELVREALPKWAFAVIDPASVYSGNHAGKGAFRPD